METHDIIKTFARAAGLAAGSLAVWTAAFVIVTGRLPALVQMVIQ